MGWAAVSVLGFALEIALVIAMARNNTARWERDHRAARAQVRAREEAKLRLRAAALVAQRVPHPHLAHLPHVHLPPRVVDRLTLTRGVLRRPHLPLTFTRPDRQPPPQPPPVPPPAPAPASSDAPSEEQAAS